MPERRGDAAAPGRARLGLVSYVNSRPIGYGLLEGRQRGRFEVIQQVPSDLAESLARGAIDLALLPSVEYARTRAAGREAAIVPGIAIASLGPSESVLLLSRVSPAQIGSVAVDRSSRTSAALLRLLLRRRLRPSAPDPRFEAAAPDLPSMLGACDAALLIGDRALLAGRDHPGLLRELQVFDLGEEWTALTGLPFVFAFWAGPRRSDSPDIVAALQDSLEEGQTKIPAIAHEWAGGDLDLEERVRRYLTAAIRYRLGREELRGLETFYGILAEERLLEGSPARLVFHGTPACVREPGS